MLMTDVVATLKSWITCCHCTIVLQRWPIAALQCCRVEWTYLWLLDTERHVFLFQLYGEQDGLKSVLRQQQQQERDSNNMVVSCDCAVELVILTI